MSTSKSNGADAFSKDAGVKMTQLISKKRETTCNTTLYPKMHSLIIIFSALMEKRSIENASLSGRQCQSMNQLVQSGIDKQ